MSAGKLIVLYLITLLTFLLVDMVWLGVAAKPLYRKWLGALMATPVRWGPAIAFYLCFVIGILVFAVMPSLESGGITRAMLLGGLFGFFTYATYDMTNWATLKGWPWQIVGVDIAWGIVLCGLVSVVGYKAAVWLR